MRMNRTSPKRPHPTRMSRRWLAAAPLAVCLAAAYPATAAIDTATAAPGSAAPGSAASASAAPASAASAPPNCAPPGVKMPPCYSPQAYQLAYGVAPLLSRGIDGSGETVVMPELAQTPSDGGATDIRQDLAAFDKTFGLPAAKLHVITTVAQSATPYLANDEEITDTEMVHAIAPGATLDVVLVGQNATASGATFAAALTKVVQEGTTLRAAVVSISASVGEHFLTRADAAAMNLALEQARDQHVTVVASSGDYGAISSHPAGPPVQVSLPASDPLVLAVGGTELAATSPAGTYLGEMAWNGGADASGGGYSRLFHRPAYQDALARTGATRGVPDVAANADGDTAMAQEYGDGELRPATGTSASAPLWAGVIALADQEAGRHLGFVNPAIYAIARGPAYHRAFHDVVTGDNSVIWPTGVFVGYNAGPGWDPVTGWGSPDAQYLVPILAHATSSGALRGGAECGRAEMPAVLNARCRRQALLSALLITLHRHWSLRLRSCPMTTVPVRPAAYIRDIHAEPGDEHNLAQYRSMMADFAGGLGWPEPVVYADAGPSAGPGSEYAALVEAIAAGRHDAVLVPSAMVIGDLDQVQAFDKHCRRHGVRVYSRWGQEVATSPRMQFDVIRNVTRFTVTDEHLRLLRRAYVTWDETEFGAPEIDCKRPYGNSNVFGDIAEILEIPDSEWADEDLNPLPHCEQRFLRLHVETAVALQIALSTGEFRTGRYTRQKGSTSKWKRDEPQNL